MCIFCGGQCGGSVEYLVNLATVIGAPYCILLLSRLKKYKYSKRTIYSKNKQKILDDKSIKYKN